MSGSLKTFAKGDRGWSEGDNEKARAMIRRTRLDGSPRYTDEQIARYMGMDEDYVRKLRRTTSFDIGENRYLKNKLVLNGPPKGGKTRRRTTDGRAGMQKNALKTHCPKGHEYTPENTRWAEPEYEGNAKRRSCLTCGREAARAYLRKRREALNEQGQ